MNKESKPCVFSAGTIIHQYDGSTSTILLETAKAKFIEDLSSEKTPNKYLFEIIEDVDSQTEEARYDLIARTRFTIILNESLESLT